MAATTFTRKKPITRKTTKAPTTRRKKAAPQNLSTHILLALDVSSSMQGRGPALQQLYKEFIVSLKKRSSGDVFVSLMFFGTSWTVKFFRYKLEYLKGTELDSGINIGGNTLLFGALEQFDETYNRPDEKVDLVVVLTDGEDNQSRFVNGCVTRMAKKIRESKDVTYTFQVPDRRYRNNLVDSFGVPDGNITVWELDNVQRTAEKLDGGTRQFFDDRTSGKRQTTSFYANVDSQAAKKLTDERKAFKLITVAGDGVEVRPLVEEKMKAIYVRGSAYYQLTKPETVQSYKQIVLRNKMSGKIVEGGRAVLGLPLTGDLKIKPGDHGEWDVFVQSCSVNRKLVRGSMVLVKKSEYASAAKRSR